MARMYSRNKGKSKSRKPVVRNVPDWVTMKPDEVEALVVKLYKEGKSQSLIGLILKNEHSVPDVKALCGKTISKILAENSLTPEIPEDMFNLIKRALILRKHILANNQDKVSKRGLLLTESKVRRLMKYYKRIGKLDADWKYDPNSVKFYV